MITIKCKCGENILLDDDFPEELKSVPWSCAHGNAVYWNRCGNSRPITAFILGRGDHNNQVDHINRDYHNNLKKNLRWATKSQNSCNCGPRKTNSSGFKGVFHNGRSAWHPWTASVQFEGKRFYSKGFSSPREAAIEYNKMAKQHHGEFAYQNPIPDEVES